jgi:hypothetical protein
MREKAKKELVELQNRLGGVPSGSSAVSQSHHWRDYSKPAPVDEALLRPQQQSPPQKELN